MAGLIRQLLHQDRRADKTALRLFNQAQRRAQRRQPVQDSERRHALADAETIAAELEWLLRGELYRVNLLDSAQYQAVLTAIEAWNPRYSFDESSARQRCGFIQNGLLGLLPALKRRQQVKQLCADYHRHLVLTAAQHLKSQKQPMSAVQAMVFTSPLPIVGKKSARATHVPPMLGHSEPVLLKIQQKLQAIEKMQQTFQTRQPISVQCQSFQHVFQQNRCVIAQDRDSAAMMFVKAIATIFSLGLAAVLGIWRVKGQKTVKQIEDVWQPPIIPEVSV